MTPRRDSAPAARAAALAGLIALIALAALLPGCGGGGGSGVDTGGTGISASLAVGPVSGFGSIVVGGVHYDERGAAITDDDGQALTAAALQLGTMVRIESDLPAADGTRLAAKAQAIRVGEQVIGPLQAADPAAGTIVVLGQRIAVVSTTVFDTSLAGGLAVLATLPPATVLAVHGQWDLAGGRIVATRIERRDAAAAFVLRAPVQSYGRDARRLVLGAAAVPGVTIDLSRLDAGALPAALDVGSLQRVKLRVAPEAGLWVATALQGAGLPLADRANVEVEGRVTRLVSRADFSVDGVPVDASAASVVPTGAVLAVGARVEVEGTLRAGTIVARRVQLESDDAATAEPIELEGAISGLDLGAQRFVVRGVVVTWSATTTFEGGQAADLPRAAKVAVKGRLAADGTHVEAARIHLER